jgi:hypothetical protein
MNLYSDEGSERITSFLQSKILIDTLTIQYAFSVSLEAMLQKMKVDLNDLELKVFLADEEEISTMFSFNLNGAKVNGYGYMYMTENSLESIWLIPLERGFSKDYIEEFEAGITPEY